MNSKGYMYTALKIEHIALQSHFFTTRQMPGTVYWHLTSHSYFKDYCRKNERNQHPVFIEDCVLAHLNQGRKALV